MKLNLTSAELSLNRQIFYVETGGYDTHQDQSSRTRPAGSPSSPRPWPPSTPRPLELGISDRVVTFTLSDFGRTLEPSGDNGSVGTDHGWGSHQFVMGDAVAGGNFYGVPGGNGQIFPDLVVGGVDDVSSDDRGRWIPTTSVEQYAGTLARWFGVSSLDLPVVFPLIGNFTPNTLGFLTPGTSC